MKIKEVFKSFLTIILLFFIILCCIIMFHQCSLEPEKPIEEESPATVVVIPIESQEQDEPVEITEEVPVQATEEALPVTEETEVVEEAEDAAEAPTEELLEATEEVEEVEQSEELEESEEPEEPEEISIPDTPDLDYPFILDVYNSGYVVVEEEINWDDFVYSDAELELEDGSYYGVLFVNEDNLGSIDVEQLEGVTYFEKSQLEKYLKQYLTEEYYAELFANESELYSLDYLTEMAYSTRFDTVYLYLYLDFDTNQMPIRNLSISGKSEATSVDYSMSGAVALEPALFSAQTSVGLSLSGYQNLQNGRLELSTGLSLSNQFSFLNMVFSLPVSIYFSNTTGLSYSIGSLVGYMDYPDLSLRVTFGNVGNSGFESGSPFGFTIEKSYSYGTESALGNQYSQVIELVEDSKVEIFVNEKSVVNRTLGAGKYRVKDFVFDQGGNDIVVKVHPLSMGEDTSRDETLTFGTSYDSSLLGKGDSTWRFGVSIPRVKSTVKTSSESLEKRGFVVPSLPSYNPKTKKFDQMQNLFLLTDFSMFWEQSLGLFNNYTQTNSLSMVAQKQSNGEYWMSTSLNVSGTLATKIGTSRFKIGGDMTVGKINSDGGVSNLALRLTYSQSFVEPILKPLSLSLMFNASSSKQTISLNTGYSFKLWDVSVGASLSMAYNFMTQNQRSAVSVSASSEKAFTYNLAMSFDVTLGKKVNLSVSTALDQDFNFSAVVGLSTSIGKVSVSSSSSIRKSNVSTSLSMGYSQDNNSYSLGFSNIQFTDLLNHTAALSWSHKGNYSNLSLRVQASNRYQSLSYAGYLTTAFAFADGHLALTNGTSGPFILIVPQGVLKKADLSVSAAMNSSVKEIKKTFGTGYYSGLKLYSTNSVIIYAGSESFMFQANPVASQGYVAKIYLEENVSVTALLKVNDEAFFDSTSSPVYKVELAEDGVSVLSRTLLEDSYMFTDDEGRFVIDSLTPGVYMFDLPVDKDWYAVFVEVPSVSTEADQEYTTRMAMYADYVFETNSGSSDKYDISTFDSTYAGSITLELQQVVTQDEFWELLYGSEADYFEEY